MWSVIKSEMRQWSGLQVMTLLAGLSLTVVAWTIERDNASGYTRALDYRELRVVFVWLFFCSAPVLVGWYSNLYQSKTSTFLLIDTLPFCRARLNLTRLLSLFVQFLPVLVAWTAHFLLMKGLDRPFSPWLVVALIFYLLFWAAAALCHRYLWVIMWILIALSAVTNSLFKFESLNFVPRQFSLAWTALVFAVLTLSACWWLIKRCPKGSRV